MSDINVVVLSGRVGRDPVSKDINGRTKAVFSVGSTRRWGSEDDEQETTWMDVESWGPKADYVVKNIQKGDAVSVKGRIEVHQYEKDGVKKFYTYITAEEICKVYTGKKEGAATSSDDRYESLVKALKGGKFTSLVKNGISEDVALKVVLEES